MTAAAVNGAARGRPVRAPSRTGSVKLPKRTGPLPTDTAMAAIGDAVAALQLPVTSRGIVGDLPDHLARGAALIDATYTTENDPFPAIDHGEETLFARVLVQLRKVASKTAGGIILTEATKAGDEYETVIGKVVGIGPLAFRDPFTGDPLHGGPQYALGDFVRVSKYGGDRFVYQDVVFVQLEDKHIRGKIKPGHPRLRG